MVMGKGIRLFIFITIIVGCYASGSCDGCYIPSRAFPSYPSISHQAAFIKFENGEETLIVESSMDSEEGARFAWLLPLPAEPTSIKRVSPGFLQTLQFTAGPNIIGRGEVTVFWALMALLLSIILTISLVTYDPAVRAQCQNFLIGIGIIVVLAGISVSNMLGGGAVVSSDARTLKYEQVGNYDVAVVKAESAKGLYGWITSHDFAPIPGKYEPVLEDYMSDGWIFLLSRLQRKDTGLLTPHPLEVTFPCDEPIYPLRLTALGESETDITLFVSGQESYYNTLLNVQMRDRFLQAVDTSENLPYVYSQGLGIKIGHPKAALVMSQGSWLTRLHARLAPEEMSEDIILKPYSVTPFSFQEEIYTRRAALKKSLVFVYVICAVLFPFIGLLFKKNRKEGKKAVVVVVLLALAVGAVEYSSLPITPDAHSVRMFRMKRARQIGDMRTALQTFATPTGLDPARRDEIVSLISGQFENLYTGEPIREMDSPGNFTLTRNKEGTLTFALLDTSGFPYRIPAKPR
jgi:hypothetical protein